jgi:hypothetical protein
MQCFSKENQENSERNSVLIIILRRRRTFAWRSLVSTDRFRPDGLKEKGSIIIDFAKSPHGAALRLSVEIRIRTQNPAWRSLATLRDNGIFSFFSAEPFLSFSFGRFLIMFLNQ